MLYLDVQIVQSCFKSRQFTELSVAAWDRIKNYLDGSTNSPSSTEQQTKVSIPACSNKDCDYHAHKGYPDNNCMVFRVDQMKKGCICYRPEQ